MMIIKNIILPQQIKELQEKKDFLINNFYSIKEVNKYIKEVI